VFYTILNKMKGKSFRNSRLDWILK